MTKDGPISMCFHNAKRDTFILAPLQLPGPTDNRDWDPLSGRTTNTLTAPRLVEHKIKNVKKAARKERPVELKASAK